MRKISIGTFDCHKSDIKAVVKSLKSGYLSAGNEMTEFQNKVASRCYKDYGLMVNSGQSALETAIEIAKYRFNKEKLKILVPATTYAATVWAVLRCNCEVVFCDIGSDYNLDIWKLKYDIKDIDVILTVDLCGKSLEKVQVKKIRDLTTRAIIIEDACEAFGGDTYGDIICYSFFVSHHITCGQGGMVCFNGSDWFRCANSFIAHGRTIGGDFTEHNDKWIDKFKFDRIGASYRSSNMNAAFVNSQFNRIDEIINKRKDNAHELIECFHQSPVLRDMFFFPSFGYCNTSVFQFFPIRIKDEINREDLLSYLFENGIDSRVLLSLTNQEIIRELYGEIENDYPVAKECNRNGFIVGCHQGLDKKDMRYIIQTLEKYVGVIQ